MNYRQGLGADAGDVLSRLLGVAETALETYGTVRTAQTEADTAAILAGLSSNPPPEPDLTNGKSDNTTTMMLVLGGVGVVAVAAILMARR
jgi:hypothetical protein